MTDLDLSRLSPRQRKVVELLLSGLSYRQTAKASGIPHASVSNLVIRSEAKLGVRLPRNVEDTSYEGKMARVDARIAAEPRCTRCELRGHATKDCDKPRAEDFVFARREEPLW